MMRRGKRREREVVIAFGKEVVGEGRVKLFLT